MNDELVYFYQQQAAVGVFMIPWLTRLQEQALDDFSRLGFPSRALEDWKYTSMDSFLQEQFLLDSLAAATTTSHTLTARKTDVPIGRDIAIINGVVTDAEALAANLPKGVIVQSLSDALTQHPEKLEPYLGHVLQQQHGFHALNTAMLQTGLFIYIPEDVCLDEPLLLSHWQDKSNQAAYLRHVIVAERGSSVTIIEDYQGEDTCTYFTNTVTEIFAANHATVRHYKIQRESKNAYHIGHLAAIQSAQSRVESHSFSFGGKLVRSDTTIRLKEENATCLMNGIYVPGEAQHIDHHTVVHHEVANCQSEQDYKGILSGHSRGVFNGKVIVAKDAQKTVAKQQNKNILLSAKAEIDTKPQLEIFADDVVCTHGATVGQLDEDALFYMMARGIDRKDASQLLIQAFAAENVRLLGESKLCDWLGELLNQQLG